MFSNIEFLLNVERKKKLIIVIIMVIMVLVLMNVCNLMLMFYIFYECFNYCFRVLCVNLCVVMYVF